jgi:hypothetical protein
MLHSSRKLKINMQPHFFIPGCYWSVAQFDEPVRVEFPYLPMVAGSYLRFTNTGSAGESKPFKISLERLQCTT